MAWIYEIHFSLHAAADKVNIAMSAYIWQSTLLLHELSRAFDFIVIVS
jgi:hypothetical protein